MKLAVALGIFCAIFVHAAIMLFGGILFMDEKKDAGSVQAVDLLSDLDAEAKKEEPKPEEQKQEETEELASDEEQPPDSAEIMRSLEPSPMDNTPRLEDASLSAIEAALSGQSGGGEFGDSLSFASGGKIGGAGAVGGSQEKMEEAFSLAEIDQKPRAVFQASPIFPAEMRGKKIEGLVTLIFVVDATGKILDPRVEKSSHTAFESPALAAVKKWKFEPGVKAGTSVASKMRVSIRFPAS